MWYPEFTIIYILLFVATAVAIASLVLVIIVLKKLSDVEITLSTMKKYRDFSPAAPTAQGEIPQPQNRNVIFCKNCANEYDASLSFCPNCGARR